MAAGGCFYWASQLEGLPAGCFPCMEESGCLSPKAEGRRPAGFLALRWWRGHCSATGPIGLSAAARGCWWESASPLRDSSRTHPATCTMELQGRAQSRLSGRDRDVTLEAYDVRVQNHQARHSVNNAGWCRYLRSPCSLSLSTLFVEPLVPLAARGSLRSPQGTRRHQPLCAGEHHTHPLATAPRERPRLGPRGWAAPCVPWCQHR